MRFCTHCGAQIPDNAKFCSACGTSIYAPDEATVIISDPEEETADASAGKGEFTAATGAKGATPRPQPQPQPQPQPAGPAQPGTKKPAENKGGLSHVWLFLKVLIIAILAVMLLAFLRGIYLEYTSPADKAGVQEQAPSSRSDSKIKPEEADGFQSLDDMSPSEREEYTKALLSRTGDEQAEEKERMVTVGTVKFLLAGDYKIASRERLQNGEACIIVPKNAPDQDNRLKLVVIPDALADINGLTSEELHNMLAAAVDALEEELAEGKYDIHYEDNADGKYFPHCYSFRNFQNPRTDTYTEATLVSGNLLSGCCVATDEAELAALMDIYSAVVAGAFL